MSKEQKIKKKMRIEMPEQDPNVRKNNFNEVPQGYTQEMAEKEAARCLQCKKPYCVEGCPVEVDIPKFIKYVSLGDFSKASSIIWEKNSLPAICGRVCPQEIQCEGKCVLNKKNNSVAIGNLERFVSDWALKNNVENVNKNIKSLNKKVAIVGSGPSSLTVAGDLIKNGYDVTVFEAFHRAGGVLIYGIPEFRLPKDIVKYEINSLKKSGVKFKLNSVIGCTMTLDELFDDGFNAIYLGVGAGLPKFMNIPGENLIGILSSNEYLTRANLMKAYKFPEVDTPMPNGSEVVVLGAGNVAMDSARTALRLGAKSVKIVYRRSDSEMPARKAEIHHAKEEGIEFLLLTNPVGFIGNKDGKLIGMKCIKMKLGEPDLSGRKSPIAIIGSEFEIKTDLAIISVGSGATSILTQSANDINLNKWGYITTEVSSGKTSKNKVWAGGDIVTGAATVILAMGAGRVAARSIHNYLTLGW